MDQKIITVSTLARQDLEVIWTYIAQDSQDTADRFILYMQGVFDRVLAFPLSGRARPEIHPNIRSIPYGNYLVFYRPTDSGIEIARIVHGARDLSSLFD